jgi:hypothetical protein
MDTIVLTPKGVKAWKQPPFQRPLRVNDRVREIAAELKVNGGVIPGVLTLGELGRETYLLDGQHRIEAFNISALDEGISDVRIVTFQDMGEMGEHFVRLNSAIVKMRPDDILRGLEGTLAPLAEIRRRCPFVGYDQIRRGLRGPLLSMSAALRCWYGATCDIPKSSTDSAAALAQRMTDEDAGRLVSYLSVIQEAWGQDPEYWRLWGGLNLTICCWLYQRTVVNGYSAKSVRLTKESFRVCAMALSANGDYLQWLHARQLSDRDRSPCYSRVKAIFGMRHKELNKGVPGLWPSPAWSASHQKAAGK